MEETGAFIGTVSVLTSKDGGLPLEAHAERIVNRLIFIGEQAPEPIRVQAFAFRDKIYEVVLHGLQQAVASDRAYRPKEK